MSLISKEHLGMALQSVKNLLTQKADKSEVELKADKSEVELKMNAENPVGSGSFSMGRKPDSTIGASSHAEGYYTTASGENSHAEGYYTTASGENSHAEGYYTTASGYCSRAEGDRTTASGTSSHAEGEDTNASGENSHAEGFGTTASGKYSHAEGYYTTASGNISRAEGSYTTASGYCSHAEGDSTVATSKSQHVQGELNIVDTAGSSTTRGKYAHIVGNGVVFDRSNAYTLDWNGVGWYQGGLQVGGNAQDDGAKNVLLEGDAIPVPSSATTGQILAVKSVDETGKPTEWEAVDAPQGGGESAYPGDDHINDLIHTALGVIENGTY